jgi:predicted GIY-YIG superfamily endonuclease
MTQKFTYVYLLNSSTNPSRHYTGMTGNLQNRLREHNAGKVVSTTKHRPWRIDTAIAFRNIDKATVFEKYLKSHSGRAFASKHF